MHLVLSISPTTLTASIWPTHTTTTPLHHIEVAFRRCGQTHPHSTHNILLALDSALPKLAPYLGAVTAITGTVPLPTALCFPRDSSPFLPALDRTLPLTQVPPIAIHDPFSTLPVPAAFAPGTLAGAIAPATTTGQQFAPLGFFLTALLLETSTGCAVTPQEADLFGAPSTQMYLGCSGSSSHLMSARTAAPGNPLGTVSEYWQQRWSMSETAKVFPFLPEALAAATTLDASPRDLVLIHGDVDYMLAPVSTLSAPLAGGAVVQWNGKPVAVGYDPNGAAAREAVRDKYANGGWDVLGHLASRIPPRGTCGFDNKLFAFVHPYPVPGTTSLRPGTTRFESGVAVPEFKDLRANSRCVLESLVLGVAVQVQALGAEVERVVVAGEASCGLAEVTAAVFPVPTFVASSDGHMVSRGAVLVADTPAAAVRVKHVLPLTPATTGQPASRIATRPLASNPPLSPPLHNALPPSPATSEHGGDEDGTEGHTGSSSMRAVAGAAQWKHDMYAAMLPAYARMRRMLVMGLVAPRLAF